MSQRKRIIDLLQTLWEQNPKANFGYLLYNILATNTKPRSQRWNLTDDELEAHLTALLKSGVSS